MSDIAHGLEGLGLGHYAQVFADNDIDQDLLANLTDEELEKLGIGSLGHRKRLLAGIAKLTPPPEIVGVAAAALSEGERRPVTVMIADLTGFTSLSRDLGVGTTLLVRGEAGIGKTRLIKEFCDRAKEVGYSCHTSLVLEFGAGAEEDPFYTLVRSVLDLSVGATEAERQNAVERALADPDGHIYKPYWMNPQAKRDGQ